jgi:hypothetical protein
MGAGSDKMHFWRLPNLGAYFAIQVKYDTCLNEATLSFYEEKQVELLTTKRKEDEENRIKAEAAAAEAAAAAAAAAEAAAAEAGEEGAKVEVVPPKKESDEERVAREEKEAVEAKLAEELYIVANVPKSTLEYALCLDTLGANRRFTDAEVQTVRAFAKLLLETSVRLDRALFAEERAKRTVRAAADASIEEPTEGSKTEEKEKLRATLEKSGLPNTDADVEFKYRQGQVNRLREHIAEFKSYNVFKGDLDVVTSLFFLLDYKKSDLVGVDGAYDWNRIRSKFNDGLFNSISQYDPREPQFRPKGESYATVGALQKVLANYTSSAVAKKNRGVGAFYDLISAALAVKAVAKAERVEAKRKAKEEADAAAAAAARANAEVQDEPQEAA